VFGADIISDIFITAPSTNLWITFYITVYGFVSFLDMTAGSLSVLLKLTNNLQVSAWNSLINWLTIGTILTIMG
jgi:hypothetical protein